MFKDIGFFWGAKGYSNPPLKILRGLSSLSPPCFLILSLCIWLASTKPIPRIFTWGGCKFFKSESLPDFLNVGILQKFWCFFYLRGCKSWQKRTLPWILSHFFVQKYIKFPIFQTSFARKQQFGGLFCRLGNLGGAMHPCTSPSNGHAFNMYNWW